MTFFVVFAALVAYVDWRPIALSAAVTASHHLILDRLAREVVFPEEGLGRVALHGVVVIVECGVLFWIVAQMRALFTRSEQSLSKAESLLADLRIFQSAIAESKDCVLIMKAEDFEARRYRIAYANPALEKLTGCTRGELIGKSDQTFWGPRTDLAKILLLRQAIIDRVRRVENIIYYRRDGSEVECETSAHGIVDEAGNITHVVTVSRDNAERKVAEAAMFEARIAHETNNILRREIAQREQAQQELQHAAFHDQLTGLPNRTLFYQRTKHALARSRTRDRLFVAVLFLDCDRFKYINDSYGHTTGDLLLNALARRLESCLRDCDTLARLGGDEFTILFEDVPDEAQAEKLAARVMHAFTEPFILGGKEVFATVSIGIALNLERTESADDLLRNADIAMYRAKADGKCRYRLFAPELAASSSRRLNVEMALRTAVERNELSVHYQPIVELGQRRLIGFEALLRWDHPEMGAISPVEFIPVAEETGLIQSIGAWVMREACRQTRSWQTTVIGAAELAINVNVSATQLLDPNVVVLIEQILNETGLPAPTLHIEITESVLMQNPDRIAAVLHELRSLGLELHLDDFGTGYSSLAYLHRFPVNALKIDKSFVSGLGRGLANPEICETIIALARQLDLSVTAEGIETSEQELQLRTLKCDRVQGYLWSKPRDRDAATSYLLEAPHAAHAGA